MRHRGFSLIEMLIVAAVLGVLMAILLPALGRVRAAGRDVQCKANLRQMAIAAQRYAVEFDAYPVAVRYENDGAFKTVAWDWVQTASGEISPGPLWAHSDHPGEVQQCPDYHGHSSFGADPYTGYNYNTSYIGGEASYGGGWDDVRWGVRPALCRRESTCAVFGDGGRAGGTNKFMRAPGADGSLTLIYNGGQSFRHSGGTNVSYLDGHVGSVEQPRKGKRASDSLLDQWMGFPDNGFLSDTDRAYDPR